jgi:Coiled-coil domain-containing protein 124 /Oxs1
LTGEKGPALSASNIDDALDALSLAAGGTDAEKKSLAGIDRHPERRQKAALAAFEDKRLPELRQEHPGLRLQQYKDLIFKEFQKVSVLFFGVGPDVSRRRIRLIRSMPRIMLHERT